MKKILTILLICSFIFCLSTPVLAENSIKSGAEPTDDYIIESDVTPEIDVPSAILVEAKTGTVLFSKNADEKRAPASVTKVMTLLLVAEAIESGTIGLTDEVCISSYAASMGGSQVFLREGERLSVNDLIKCTVIASANDAAVALAEYTAGSESIFVDMMNNRASDLGLVGTNFENVTGLDDDTVNHTMSSEDIAVISRELIKHKCITDHSSVWQDSIRNGEFTLTNTNRLVRYYDGCTGLKTGSTDKAGFCVAASAKRGSLELIAVIMGAESGTARNEAARTLLDFGFSSFAVYESQSKPLGEITVTGGEKRALGVTEESFFALINKKDVGKVRAEISLPKNVKAPISKGDVVGVVIYRIGDEEIGRSNIRACSSLEKMSFPKLFARVLLSSVTSHNKSREKS